MFFRKILNELELWAKDEDRKPLILRGARQVGKTTAVEIFSKKFDQFIYLNLEVKKDADLFNQQLSIDDLIQAIFLHKNVVSTSGKVLLFIDEIQNSPPAVAMMRYFYESAKPLHIIAAGSLLETLMSREQISFPVGRVQYMFMYPLTFEEFLLATGKERAAELLHQVPIPAFALSSMLDYFHRYTLIGGMPEVVKKYSEKRNIMELIPVFQGLTTSFIDDVSKYARNKAMEEIISYAIEVAPLEAGKRIKFQGFGSSNYRSREMGEALRTLERAMLLYLLYPTTSTQPPAKPDRKKSPRLQFLDTGLINYVAGLQKHYFKVQTLHSFYQGLMAEHIVGQELMAMNMKTSRKISFWVREKRQSSAEVDFIVPYGRHLIPVEVKAGKAGTLRSLHQFVDKADHPYAVRLYAGPLEKIQIKTPKDKPFTLLNMPYFLSGKIKEYIEWMIAEG
jgi:predicted AAA+ superfamily ATPase